MESETRAPYPNNGRRSQFFAQLEEDRKMLRAIHGALIGDGLGNPGLVKRIEVVETLTRAKADQADVATIAAKVETHDRKLWVAGISLTGAWTLALAFSKKFFGA